MIFDEKEFAKGVVKAHFLQYASKQNSDYELDEEQYEKLNSVIEYCQTLEKDYGCKIIRCMMEPRYQQGYIQVLFQGELAIGEKDGGMQSFVNALKLCDGINITTNPAGDEMFQITFFVEGLWLRKKGKC